MILNVGVILGMPVQCQIFPPLAAILTTRHCRRSTAISAHLSSRAWQSSPRFWGGLYILVIAQPNSSQICSMGCSLVILHAATSWRCCPAEENQGLHKHGEVWHYRLSSSNNPWNAAWKMTVVSQSAPVELTSEVSTGEHKRHFGTTVESSPDVYWNTTSMDPISLAPLLEALTR